MGSRMTLFHGGGPLWPPLVFLALGLPKAKDMLSDKYFGLQLSIDTKNSPLCNIILALLAAKRRKSKKKISGQKYQKFQNLSYRRAIYLKRKLRTYTKQIQPVKVRFSAKKLIFFNFFNFSRHARGPPKIFDVQFSKIFTL